METIITLDLTFKFAAFIFLFVCVGFALILVYLMGEIQILKEAITTIVAADPKLAKKVESIVKKERVPIDGKVE